MFHQGDLTSQFWHKGIAQVYREPQAGVSLIPELPLYLSPFFLLDNYPPSCLLTSLHNMTKTNASLREKAIPPLRETAQSGSDSSRLARGGSRRPSADLRGIAVDSRGPRVVPCNPQEAPLDSRRTPVNARPIRPIPRRMSQPDTAGLPRELAGRLSPLSPWAPPPPSGAPPPPPDAPPRSNSARTPLPRSSLPPFGPPIPPLGPPPPLPRALQSHEPPPPPPYSDRASYHGRKRIPPGFNVGPDQPFRYNMPIRHAPQMAPGPRQPPALPRQPSAPPQRGSLKSRRRGSLTIPRRGSRDAPHRGSVPSQGRGSLVSARPGPTVPRDQTPLLDETIAFPLAASSSLVLMPGSEPSRAPPAFEDSTTEFARADRLAAFEQNPFDFYEVGAYLARNAPRRGEANGYDESTGRRSGAQVEGPSVESYDATVKREPEEGSILNAWREEPGYDAGEMEGQEDLAVGEEGEDILKEHSQNEGELPSSVPIWEDELDYAESD
ncbi:uncharacterized protein SCHCODRAFT_02746250 [Schizophyllum commune H4-8]|uniref:Expressed protein n=1 Tax=Schizophyllum commune (strain H4-8 / FGSC 9210) TaxID=578458 RepID=D8Q340_SCHCM|nr:uncharacterized protein SCHCODRAFT_02746250 [Schizophyllum commune H4-8]KAI5894729.1 hypothetical protein SCHCODRAFT_02746250 [Schizophyllum commune H4-8]